jgi:hypothetical protein
VNLVFLRAPKAPPAAFAADAEEPIRAELFSIERLEQHAESLAAAQSVTTRPTTGRRFATRLRTAWPMVDVTARIAANRSRVLLTTVDPMRHFVETQRCGCAVPKIPRRNAVPPQNVLSMNPLVISKFWR